MTNLSSSNDSSLQLAKQFFELVREGVCWVDASGGIRGANARASEILGYRTADWERLTIFQIDPNYSLLQWKRFWRQLEKERQYHQETDFMTANGLLLPVACRMQLISSGGQSLALLLFSTQLHERRYADLLKVATEEAKLGAWELDLTTNTFYLSDAFLQLTQLHEQLSVSPSKDQVRKAVGKRLDTKDLETLVRHIRVALETLEPFEMELRFRVNESEVRRYTLRALVSGNDLNPIKLYGTIRDMSALQSSDDQNPLVRFALEQTSDLIMWSQLGQGVQYVNQRICQVLGYSKGELLAMQPDTLLADWTELRNDPNWYNRLREEKRLSGTCFIPCKGGGRIWAKVQMDYLELEEGSYHCIFLRDISKQRHFQEKWQRSNKALNSLREWIFWIDPNDHIISLNQEAESALSTFGITTEGLSLAELFPGFKLPEQSVLLGSERSGERLTREYDLILDDGQTIHLLISVSVLERAENALICLCCSDITEVRRRERELQAARERELDLKRQLQEENDLLREEIDTNFHQNIIVTVDKSYRPVLEQVAQVAETDATVLITGETGTGKELLARSIHTFSDRADKPLVSVNCAALPNNLIESELFGHEKGAFTGAYNQKKGRFELAHQGTIFLDEIGEVPPDVQAKLLRVLQEGEFQRVGGTKDIKVDVRIVAATNRDLEEMVEKGTFREDLFYRLNVFPIHNLPLRERREDIPILIKHFTQIYATKMGRDITHIPQVDLEQIKHYNFPGNVRELINIVERAVILTKSETLNLHQSFSSLRRGQSAGKTGKTVFRSFEEMQRDYIIEALKRTKGRVTGPKGAAALLDMNGRTLMSKMRKLEIDRSKYE